MWYFLEINYIVNKTKKLKEPTFLLISLVYFGTFLIFNPPLEVPDEPSHFYSAYNFSQNGLDGSKITNINTPDNIECLIMLIFKEEIGYQILRM